MYGVCVCVCVQGVTQKKKFFLGGGGGGGLYEEVQSRDLWSSTHKKQLGICIEYTYISELMVCLHQGKFVNLQWVKIPV